MKDLSRRHFLGLGAAGVGFVALGAGTGHRRAAEALDATSSRGEGPEPGRPVRPDGAASTPPSTVPEQQQAAEAPPPWSAVAPLKPATRLSASWHVESLSAVVAGSAVLAIRHASGKRADLRIYRRGPASVGIAQTNHLDLLLVNNAKGKTPTQELLARVIRATAHTIATYESTHPGETEALVCLSVPSPHHC